MASELNQNKNWLNALYDAASEINTFSSCLSLVDFAGDGENRLILTDFGQPNKSQIKLKLYKGVSCSQETNLIDRPAGVVALYVNKTEPRIPAIAIASGPFVFVFKNMKPFFKFKLPELDVNPAEFARWQSYNEEKITAVELKNSLNALRNEGIQLSARSVKALQHTDVDKLNSFCSVYRGVPLRKQTVATCIATLNKSHAEPTSVNCLVVGTESCQIHIIDSEAFTLLNTFECESVPVFFSISGLYDVEFRIISACRNGGIYQIKRGSTTATKLIQLASQPVGLIKSEKNFIIGCMDQSLLSVSLKGKIIWKINFPSEIYTMAPFHCKQGAGVFIALGNGKILLYMDKDLVDIISLVSSNESTSSVDPVQAMTFGQYGRETACLVMITCGGAFCIKLLKRNVQFHSLENAFGPPTQQFQKLNIPKKTKLFVDQTIRERENSISIHRQFLHDMYLLRLNSMKSFVEVLETKNNPISVSAKDPIKISAEVLGIGPTFKLKINLQNDSTSNVTRDMYITFSYDINLYKISDNFISMPYLVPSVSYPVEVKVTCLNDKGVSGDISIFVGKVGSIYPITTAILSMPVSENVIVS